MSRGYRRYIATLAGLAIVAGFLWLLIQDLSSVDSAYSHAAADASVKYERDSQTYVKERCFAPSGLGEVDCTSKADEAKREGQRKEQDLAAQNITAWWTKVMGIAALIGMALSAVGVWLVYTTFNATREANIIASNTAKNQLRPYIHPFGKHATFTTTRSRTVKTFNFRIDYANFGQTPALKLTARLRIFVGPDNRVNVFDDWCDDDPLYELGILGPSDSSWMGHDSFTLPNRTFTALKNAKRGEGGQCLRIVGVFNYTDATNTPYATNFSLNVMGEQMDTGFVSKTHGGNTAT